MWIPGAAQSASLAYLANPRPARNPVSAGGAASWGAIPQLTFGLHPLTHTCTCTHMTKPPTHTHNQIYSLSMQCLSGFPVFPMGLHYCRFVVNLHLEQRRSLTACYVPCKLFVLILSVLHFHVSVKTNINFYFKKLIMNVLIPWMSSLRIRILTALNIPIHKTVTFFH